LVADLALMSNLVNYHYLGYAIDPERFPKLAAYFARHLRHPAIATALAAEKPVAQDMGLKWQFADELPAA
jgi:glutathione S-transferase